MLEHKPWNHASIYSEEAARLQLLEKLNDSDDELLLAIVLDLDETIANTVLYWNGLLNRLLARYTGHSQETLPTISTVKKLGGTDGAYKHMFADAQTYEMVLEYLRHKKRPNLVPPMTEENIAEKIRRAVTSPGLKAHIIGSITARPGTEEAMKATEEQLFSRYGIEPFPVLGRPSRISTQETSNWKIAELKELAFHRPQKTLIIIDDSAGLTKAIATYNASKAATDPLLVQIVYPGPLTHMKIASGELQENKNLGVFISTGWETMGSTLLDVQGWLQLHNQTS